MENIKMVLTLFIFCFVAAFLLAYVDKKTHPIISRLKAQQEAKAKKEVLLLKDGGVSLSSFPAGSYKAKLGNSFAEFTIKNNEVHFSKLVLNGVDYLQLSKKIGTKNNGKFVTDPISILLKSFNEKRVIDTGKIISTKKGIEIARAFLKKHPQFVSSLIDLMLSPVHYEKKSVIYMDIKGKVQPVVIKNAQNTFTVNGKKVKYLRDGHTIKILKIGDKKVANGKEYPVKDFYDAYYGKKYIGTVFKIAPICFADKVVTVVGVRPDGRVSGIKVLSQAETPGLGARVLEVKKGEKEPWWQAEFHNLKVSDLYLKHKDIKVGKIDAFTAATITPRKLTAGIRKAVENYLTLRKTLNKEVSQ